MEESQFDVIIFGTGLVNSITAAALSKAGYKVAHVDSNPYYGGEEAVYRLKNSYNGQITLQSRQYSICLQPAVLPSLGPLISSLVSSGVAKYSGFKLLDCVSVYHSSGHVKSVPGSKEDIFKNKEISLIEKRRLMRFLTFAAGDFEDKQELEGKHELPFVEFLPAVFSLSEEITSVIAYSLAFCMASTEPTLPTLQRLRRYLRSGGRYGPSPFLIGHYGGIGDIAQGFCRAAAVSGGVYILSRQITDIARVKPAQISNNGDDQATQLDEKKRTFNYAVNLNDFPDTLSCNLVISPPSYVPPNLKDEVRQLPPASSNVLKSNAASIARCISIIDQALALRSRTPEPEPISAPESTEPAEQDIEGQPKTQPPPPVIEDQAIDTAVLVFPPSSVKGGSTTHSATVFINGEGSLSTPKGKWLLYITLPLASTPEESVTPEILLRPYLDALLLLSVDPSKSPIKPLFTAFYLENPAIPFPPSGEKSAVEEISNTSSTYIIPATLPIAPLPDIPDEAAVIAENTFMEAAKILRKINPPNEDEEEAIVFWPPLPADDDDDDSEW
ncbi:GDP dissociation inhibitor-domain-containing protein [Flammula alnicola]|nr:GDP dissociation inhibitor-domain-containing protein [Flammula alnicola]